MADIPLTINDIASAASIANASADTNTWLRPSDISVSTALDEPIMGWSGEADATIEAFTATGMGVAGEASATLIFLPAFDAIGAGIVDGIGSAVFSLPKIAASALGVGGEVGSGLMDIPPMELSGGDTDGTGIAEITYPALSVDGVGVRGVIGQANLSVPMPSAIAGDILNAIGSADLSLPKIAFASSGGAGQYISAFLGLPAIRLEASGTNQPYEGSVNIEFPAIDLSADGVEDCTGAAAFELPVLTFYAMGEADIMSDIQNGYLAIEISAMNNRNAAVTDWMVDFNSMDEFSNYYYAASPQGIFILEGSQDNGSEIDCDLGKLEFDLGSEMLKRVTDVYLRVRAENDYSFTIYADGVSVPISVTDGNTGIHLQKVDLPRGLKGRRLGFSIANQNGGNLAVEKMEMNLEILARRARF